MILFPEIKINFIKMNIPDLTGKYKSSDGGSIIITHREKVDGNIYTISGCIRINILTYHDLNFSPQISGPEHEESNLLPSLQLNF